MKHPNPFEMQDAEYHVLVNDEGQHSLWPAYIQVPQGWSMVFERQSREACQEYINTNWTDMRPTSIQSKHTLGNSDNADHAHMDAVNSGGERVGAGLTGFGSGTGSGSSQ
ncbi:MbtH family protein [Paenibacillus turpanensis]|uniref:MbtH family protein n=1 Tax=Paenibacillus turpanensis TaxID=2689078 RepID=UPI00140C9DCC